jgi:hypothetical protein
VTAALVGEQADPSPPGQDRLQGIRSKPEDELAGLGLPEMGTPAYTDVDQSVPAAVGATDGGVTAPA